MTNEELPSAGREWLDAVERSLQHIDADERRHIVDGLRAHILDALAEGSGTDDVLRRLGPASAVAAEHLPDASTVARHPAPPAETPSRTRSPRRVAQAAAFALAILSAVAIGVLPGEVRQSVGADGSLVTETVRGFQDVWRIAPAVTVSMLCAVVLAALPLLVPTRRIVAIVSAMGLVIAAVLGIVLGGAWPLLGPALVGAVALALPPRMSRRASRAVAAAA